MNEQGKTLFHHTLHPHVFRNDNLSHAAGHQMASINKKIAFAVTHGLCSMWRAYFFITLAIYGFPGFQATPKQYFQWFSQTFI